MADSLLQSRARLAKALFCAGGVGGEQLERRVAAAREDAEFADRVLTAFLSSGAYDPVPRDPSVRRVRLGDLRSLPPCAEMVTFCDRSRAKIEGTLELVRLARVYALLGHPETAASCFRRVLARGEPLSLPLTLELAEAAAKGGDPSLALAGVDWVAECLLTREEIAVGPRSQDRVRDDPLAVGALLEKARDISMALGQAPRAVAFSRAAVSTFERMGRLEEARAALGAAARALREAGDAKKAMAVAKRLRTQAQEEGDVRDEARAMAEVATQLASRGQREQAISVFQDTAKLLFEGGEPAAAVEQVQAAVKLLVRTGALDQACQELITASDLLNRASLTQEALEMRFEEARLRLQQGHLGAVLTSAESLRKAWEQAGRPERVASAVVLLGWALALAGDGERAQKALARTALQVGDWETAAASLRARAEVAIVQERPEEARLLLADAARAFQAADDALGKAEALLRQAEVALDADDPEGCRSSLGRLNERDALPAQLELRADVLQARLTQDPDEQELLLEDVYDQSCSNGLFVDRVRSAVARARLQLDRGDAGAAEATLKPVLSELLSIKNGLPEPLQKGLRRSPLARQVLALAEGRAGQGGPG